MQFKNITFTEDKMLQFLESLGFENIKSYENEIKFSWTQGSSPTGCCLFKDSLYFTYWSKNIKGDLIELIKHKLECNYREAFVFLEKFSNQKIESTTKPPDSAYTRYLKTLEMMTDEQNDIFDVRLLNDYEQIVSDLFIKDGIGGFTQHHFGVCYDEQTGRVCIPIRNEHCQLIGLLGRYNKKHIDGNHAKYLPIIAYRKHLVLFGLGENKRDIEKTKTLCIVESEKSVLRAWSLGIRNVVALGTCRVSQHQKRLIEESGVDRVVLLLDEGLEDNFYQKEARGLVSDSKLYPYDVYYINANECGLGKKNCLFDESREKIQEVLTTKLYKIEKE